MSIRLGFILGFLAGAVAAALMSPPKPAEAPASESGAAPASGEEASGLLARVRQQVREARQVAHDASLEKEAELRRELDDAIKRRR